MNQETQYLEFKNYTNGFTRKHKQQIAKEIVAFSNSKINGKIHINKSDEGVITQNIPSNVKKFFTEKSNIENIIKSFFTTVPNFYINYKENYIEIEIPNNIDLNTFIVSKEESETIKNNKTYKRAGTLAVPSDQILIQNIGTKLFLFDPMPIANYYIFKNINSEKYILYKKQYIDNGLFSLMEKNDEISLQNIFRNLLNSNLTPEEINYLKHHEFFSKPFNKASNIWKLLEKKEKTKKIWQDLFIAAENRGKILFPQDFEKALIGDWLGFEATHKRITQWKQEIIAEFRSKVFLPPKAIVSNVFGDTEKELKKGGYLLTEDINYIEKWLLKDAQILINSIENSYLQKRYMKYKEYLSPNYMSQLNSMVDNIGNENSKRIILLILKEFNIL